MEELIIDNAYRSMMDSYCCTNDFLSIGAVAKLYNDLNVLPNCFHQIVTDCFNFITNPITDINDWEDKGYALIYQIEEWCKNNISQEELINHF